MSALRSISAAARCLPATAAPAARRQASTIPHSYSPPHYTFKERLHKFVPVESYPLLAFVVCMSTFGITRLVHSINAVPDELRLIPDRYKGDDDVKPWEDPRALAGKW
ncbi:hypothetical protein JCM6882_001886 [Rhodosporidiobolus microsporus]